MGSQGKILRRNVIIFLFLKDKQNLAIGWEDKEKAWFSIMSRFLVWECRWIKLPFVKKGSRNRWTSLGMGWKCWVWVARGIPEDRCAVGSDRIWTQKGYRLLKPSFSFWSLSCLVRWITTSLFCTFKLLSQVSFASAQFAFILKKKIKKSFLKVQVSTSFLGLCLYFSYYE